MSRKLKFIFFRSGIFALLIVLRGNKQFSSPLVIFKQVVSSTVQIILLQETLTESDPNVLPSATITSKIPTFVSSNRYAWSAWFYKTAGLNGGNLSELHSMPGISRFVSK